MSPALTPSKGRSSPQQAVDVRPSSELLAGGSSLVPQCGPLTLNPEAAVVFTPSAETFAGQALIRIWDANRLDET